MFCRNCGKEVDDNAYVCTGCGCLVNDGKVRRKEAVEGQNKKGKIAKILLLVSFGLFCRFLFLRYLVCIICLELSTLAKKWRCTIFS